MIVAVNPFAFPPPLPKSKLWIPIVSSFVMEENPLLRTIDWVRGYQMFWRFAAQSQLSYADVVYNNDDPHILSTSFFAGHSIVARTKNSASFQEALHEATVTWYTLLGDPDALLVTTEIPPTTVIDIPLRFDRTLGVESGALGVQDIFTLESLDLLRRAARTFLSAPGPGTITIAIQTDAAGTDAENTALAEHRGKRIKQFFTYMGLPANSIQIQASSGPSPMVMFTRSPP